MSGNFEKNNPVDIKILNKINNPDDVKALDRNAMLPLIEEIRSELVRIVSNTGGHLASNLGVIELSVAIHRIFDCPKDHIIFDVGHQSYVHKMLTGRYKSLDTLRQGGGISGFTKRSESEYDCFGTGHSSTSISAALGFAAADKLDGNDAYTVAIIGDGAFTGGMVHEALNNVKKNLNLIIIINENEMSISKNIGRFAKNLSRLRARKGYFWTKRVTGAFFKKIPFLGKYMFRGVRGIKKSLKNMMYGSNYFESMGMTYLGPIDGNNYFAVEELLGEAKRLGESVVIHLKTKKGKGYAPAEEAPDVYHGMSPVCTKKNANGDFSRKMGNTLADIADNDKNIIAITAAMCDGTGLCSFRDRHKERFFDVGIAEGHALTFAAGLAAGGKKPVAAIYSSFLQRGYDSIVHDIALQSLPVVMCIDRAGLNSADGSTHHGIFDVSFLSAIPNIRIYTPITFGVLEAALMDALRSGMPCAIRYPSGCENDAIINRFYSEEQAITNLGIRTDFKPDIDIDIVIVTHGRICEEAMAAEELLAENSVKAGIILLEMLKPYEKTAALIASALPEKACGVIFLEEEIKSGGMGICMCDALRKFEIMNNKKTEILAVDDNFADRKSNIPICRYAGVDREAIFCAAKKLI